MSGMDNNDLTTIELQNQKSSETLVYNFDRIFNENSNQEDIFNEVKPFIQSALDGENVCIFAYGSTGSGKTFTMQGYFSNQTKDIQNKGILPRTAEFIFTEICRLNIFGNKYKISFSAIEIYNETVYDLLSKSDKIKQPLTIYVSNSDIQIKNLIWVDINKKEDILTYTKEASDSRRSDATQFNSTSSRSHAIFQIKLEMTKEDGQTQTSLINIIDLAGSERSSLGSMTGKSKEEVDAIKKIQNEANFINKSLTTLGRIISMIGDKKSSKLAIPYRESKLTTLLQVIVTS